MIQDSPRRSKFRSESEDLSTPGGIFNFKYQGNSKANKSEFNAQKFYDLFEEREDRHEWFEIRFMNF